MTPYSEGLKTLVYIGIRNIPINFPKLGASPYIKIDFVKFLNILETVKEMVRYPI